MNESFVSDTLDLCPPYSLMGLSTKQVVSQLPSSRSCQPVCLCYMPANGRLEVLEATKAYQREQQRLRTERRLTELRQDQRELELREVLTLFSLIWLLGIVLFYARLYLGPST
jgi:hypothetical protein